jgi:hypothetical protein
MQYVPTPTEKILGSLVSLALKAFMNILIFQKTIKPVKDLIPFLVIQSASKSYAILLLSSTFPDNK